MFQTKVGEISQDVQSFAGRNVPVSPFLYLSEDPRLNKSTSAEKKHNYRRFYFTVVTHMLDFTYFRVE